MLVVKVQAKYNYFIRFCSFIYYFIQKVFACHKHCCDVITGYKPENNPAFLTYIIITNKL